MQIPVVDISPLRTGYKDRQGIARQMGDACHEFGFFYVVGHGVEELLQSRLEGISRRFFAQDVRRSLKLACREEAERGEVIFL